MTDVSETATETETETATDATTATGAVRRLAERWVRDGMAAGEGRGGTGTGTGFVCSPAGLWLALAAVAAGARGATAAELRA
ncbi:serine protease, partial [Streptomyces anulatus]|nr:serine protease [Streptomyces anulatus]